MILQAGTNPIIDIQIVDDTGLPVTGLVASTFPTIYYAILGSSAAVAVTLSDLSLITSAYSSGGIKEKTGGVYRLDLPAAAVATANTTVRMIGEATGKHAISATIDVTPGVGLTGDLTSTMKASVTSAATAATPTIAGYTGNTPQTGDAFARLGSPAGASVSLDIAANLTAIQSIQNNIFIASSIPAQIQTPITGSSTIHISFVFYNETGHARNLDSGNPIITLVNGSGTDRSSRLGSWMNPVTGKYVVVYTNTSTDASENLEWDVSGAISGNLRRLPGATQIVNSIAVDFTPSDRITLDALASTLGANGNGLTNLGDNRLANLDTTVSSRLAGNGYTSPPTVSAIQSGLATHSDAVAITSAITALGSAPTTPPTVVQIRQEMDANSTRLAAAATSAGVTSASNMILSALGSPLQASTYTAPPSAASIAAATASVMFVDGSTNPLKVNPDHTVSSLASGGTIANYITVPAAVAAASQDPSVITCLRGDTLRISLPLMGNLTGRTKLVLTAKANLSDSDAQAVLQVVEETGLTRLNGIAALDAGLANLSVVNALTGAVNLEVNAKITATLAVRDLVWDAQANLSTGVISPIHGLLTVVADVTQSVS